MVCPPVISLVASCDEAALDLKENCGLLIDIAQRHQLPLELLLVHSGPLDGIHTLSRKLAYGVCLRVVNCSKGDLQSACVKALVNAVGEYLVVLPAFDSRLTAAIPDLISPLQQGRADFVRGCCGSDPGFFQGDCSGSPVIHCHSNTVTRRVDDHVILSCMAIRRDTLVNPMYLDEDGCCLAHMLINVCECEQICEVPINGRRQVVSEGRHVPLLHRMRPLGCTAPRTFC
ncbi:MAG: hypothetical protein KDA96_09510 [Planctomycetaceae bacterium]|nr:hypothetical protein [Planctomycetaceae bacterium]